MQSDWIYGFSGGLAIGIAATVYLLWNGRIMGASGIIGGLIDGSGRNNIQERLFFLAGLIGVPGLILLQGAEPYTNATSNVVILVLGGLAVGIGTRMASGCTSGHGVCGISRFSTRGIVATLAYLFFGALTMFIARHVLGVI